MFCLFPFFFSFLQNALLVVRKAFDAFFLHYPYCYGYWKKYADIEKKHENIQIAEEVNMTKTQEYHDPAKHLCLL